MPTALVDFRASLAIAHSLLTLEATYADPPSQADSLVVQGLRGGATVLMVAAFEDFLQASFLEHLSRLDGNPPPVFLSALPDDLQVTSIYASLNRALSGPRYLASTKTQRLPDVRTAAQRLMDERLDPVAMSETGNNPDAKNVKALFKSVGIGSVFEAIKPVYESRTGPVATTYLQDRLDHIVRSRHVVAHTGSALNISRLDLKEWIAFVDLIAELLDSEIDRLVTALLAAVTPILGPLPAVGAGPAAAVTGAGSTSSTGHAPTSQDRPGVVRRIWRWVRDRT